MEIIKVVRVGLEEIDVVSSLYMTACSFCIFVPGLLGGNSSMSLLPKVTRPFFAPTASNINLPFIGQNPDLVPVGSWGGRIGDAHLCLFS
jgi:hypothetical protein